MSLLCYYFLFLNELCFIEASGLFEISRYQKVTTLHVAKQNSIIQNTNVNIGTDL